MITFSAHSCLLVLSLTIAVVYSKEDPKIYFPDKSYPKTTTPKISTISTRSATDCVGSFCSELKDYPAKDADKLMDQHPELHRFFDIEDIPIIDIAQRGQMDPDSMEETLCEAKEKILTPLTGNNTKNEERIIYQGEKYQQFIYTVTCSQSTCKFQKIFPNNYEVYCKQKYVRKKLVTLEGTKPSFDIFDVPCCCVCAIKTVN